MVPVLLDQGDILVASRHPPAEVERHIHVRYMLTDRIAAEPPYQDLLAKWQAPTIARLAAEANSAFERFLTGTGYARDEVAFLFGRLVGRVMPRQHALDEPPPPTEAAVAIGEFVDRLLAGEATTGDLADVLGSIHATPPGEVDVDLRSPRALGSVTRSLAISNLPEETVFRDPLESLLADIDHVWADHDERIAEAAELLDSLGFGRWPFLASDLVHRYGAGVLGSIRAQAPTWSYRHGDPSIGSASPPGLEIPAFEPTGNALADRRRLRAWTERLAQVEKELDIAARVGEATHARTRPIRPDELATYRNHVRWFYEHTAVRTPLTKIAEAEFGDRERWRDVQRVLRRIRRLLDAGHDYAAGSAVSAGSAGSGISP